MLGCHSFHLVIWVFSEISNSPGTSSGWIVDFQIPEQCMSPCCFSAEMQVDVLPFQTVLFLSVVEGHDIPFWELMAVTMMH